MVSIKDYKRHLIERLENPEEAAAYLNVALKEDPQVFALALRDIAEAKEEMGSMGDESINLENLSRALALKGNSRFSNLVSLLDAMGLEFNIQAKPRKKKAAYYIRSI